MKITMFDIFRYRLSLNRPLVLRGQTLTYREGFVIRLTDDNGTVGWGEIAPLPGFNSESPENALAATEALAFAVKNDAVPNHLEELSGAFADWIGHRKLPPSVQCGFESAVLNLIARQRGCTLARLISDTPLVNVPVNGLISSSLEELAPELARFQNTGYRAVKLKVGRGSVEQDIAMVKQTRSGLPAEITLRLDANRTWEYDDAIAFAAGIRGCRIEYIEEPLRDTARLPEFASVSGLPIALDETLHDCCPETIPHLSVACAAIIRPGRLGGLERAMKFARRVQAHGLRSVVSSNIESAVGLAVLVNFAAALTAEALPIGLDTLSWFAEQIIAEPLTDNAALIDVAIADQRARTVELNRLEPVTYG
jgi:O-succinylbenzoate synthase